MTNNNLMTTRAVADLLGVGVSSVKRWTDEGKLTCVRTAGGHRRFETTEVDRFRREQLAQDRERKPYPPAMLAIDGYRLPAPLHPHLSAFLRLRGGVRLPIQPSQVLRGRIVDE